MHDHGWTQQQQLQEIAENACEQRSLQLHQHNQQHPQMELMEIQQQIQQPNLQTQLMEQMCEQALLLDPKVRKEKTREDQLQQQQTVMGQGRSGDQVHFFEQPVQQDETIGQKQQQQSQRPMGHGVLIKLQQQILQLNLHLQTQMMEQMKERVCLLEPQV